MKLTSLKGRGLPKYIKNSFLLLTLNEEMAAGERLHYRTPRFYRCMGGSGEEFLPAPIPGIPGTAGSLGAPAGLGPD